MGPPMAQVIIFVGSNPRLYAKLKSIHAHRDFIFKLKSATFELFVLDLSYFPGNYQTNEE